MYSADGEDETVYDGTFNEVDLAGNGTYQLTLTDADFSGETDLSQLHIATNIPLNDQIKFTDVTLNINGNDIVTFDEATMEDQENYLQGGMVALIFNHWRPELVSRLDGLGVTETAVNGGYSLLTGQGGENITITFTVSGFAYDNPDAVIATEAPAENTATDAQNDTASDSSESSFPVAGIVAIIAAVVAVIIIVIVLAAKKKK